MKRQLATLIIFCALLPVSARADAYSEVRTVLIGNSSSGGTVDINIKTQSNGVTNTETRHEVIPPGKSVIVSVIASSTASTTRPSAGSSARQRGARLFKGFSNWFGTLFSFFGR